MNIESPKWMTPDNRCLSVTIDGKNMAVPADENNTDYAAILEWVADGNVIQEAED